jgi:hypothetical protein
MSAIRTALGSAPWGSRSSVPRRGGALILAGTVVVVAVAGALVYAGTGTGPSTRSSPATRTGPAVNNLLQNPSLEDGAASDPRCWAFGGFGTNAFTWTRTSDAHSGSYAEQLDVTGLASGDRKLVTAQDAGACAPRVTPGRVYTVTAWYKANREPFLFVYYRDSAGSWVSWTNSPGLPVSSGWTRGSFTTPALPKGATHISIGLGIADIGSVTMDDFELSPAN